MPKRDAKAEGKGLSGGPEESAAPSAEKEHAPIAVSPGNTLRPAKVVIKESDIPAIVAEAVLAGQGLTQRSLVDPKTFKQQVDSWLSAPAN